ncbi:MAG: class I SAM-dependent methyltransferase [Crocinitomicaceae bacterium]|nr:class I SAM-dependent methyltransferase [Crocinitomicaceae bacterium]
MSRIFSESWNDYELLDAGNNKKLERWGTVVTIRPERNAYFRPALAESEWKKTAHFEFVEKTANSGEWKILQKNVPQEWQIRFGEIVLNLRLTKFKHVGLFPEQRINWDFVSEHLESGDRFLNLFGYTGAVSVVARKKEADVFHCDSIKQIIQWGKENMEASNLSDIHWILEDALKFAQREVKRGNKYKGIIMDPPAFGLGANKERWKIENKFEELISIAKDLTDRGGFIIANTYSPRLEQKEIMEITRKIFPSSDISCNKLCIRSKTGKIIEYGELTRIIT